MQTPAALPLPVMRICFAVLLTLNAVARVKRRRNEDEDDVDACKRRRNDEDRGTLRLTAVRRLLAMDPTLFRKMFRMHKEAFLLLHSKCSQGINPTWTPRSAAMAALSSKSHVDTLVLLACTPKGTKKRVYHRSLIMHCRHSALACRRVAMGYLLCLPRCIFHVT